MKLKSIMSVCIVCSALWSTSALAQNPNARIDALVSRIDALEQQLDDLEIPNIEALEQQVQDLQDQIIALSTALDVEKQNRANGDSTLDDRLAQLEARVTTLESGGGGGGGGGGTLTLQNDSVVAGGPVTLVLGAFSADDEYAATLGPVPGTGQLTAVRLVFGGTDPEPFPTVDVRVKVYQESGSAVPGTVLYDEVSDVLTISPSNTDLIEFDLSAANVIVNGGSTIRVSIRFVDTPATTIGPGRDADGFASPGRNWVFTDNAWVSSESLGLTSDWILRAVIQPEGS